MPGRHRLFGHHERDVHDGESYTEDELREGLVRLIGPNPDPDPPDEGVRGEPWEWTKGPPYPRGYQELQDYPPPGFRNRDDPGPYDGSWDPPGEARDGPD